MPLTLCPSGHCATIRKIGGKDETKRFLANLGFTPGEQVTIVSENGGNMIINVKDSRIALDRALAQRIVV